MLRALDGNLPKVPYVLGKEDDPISTLAKLLCQNAVFHISRLWLKSEPCMLGIVGIVNVLSGQGIDGAVSIGMGFFDRKRRLTLRVWLNAESSRVASLIFSSASTSKLLHTEPLAARL